MKIRTPSFALVALFTFSSAMAAEPPAASTSSGRTAIVDCRAGCQGDAKKCQQSLNREARLDAAPGRFFDASTLRLARSPWNASDSPGLVREPNWKVERVPENASNPTSLIVTPVVATCEGVSPHTQGVTFYEWTADYF